MNEKHEIDVLHFCNEPVRAGAEEHMLVLLRMLDRRLFRLHLVCTPELLEKFGSDLPEDVETLPLSLGSPVQMSAAARFARILRERHVDVVHSHMFRASLVASPIACICGVPVRVETAHVREHWRKGLIKSSFFVDRLAGRFVTSYIAVSIATGRYLSEAKQLPNQKITVIANGCDITKFHPTHRVPPGLRKDFGIAEGDPVLVVIARLEPQKGHRVLLETLPGVARQFPHVKVVFVGEGQLRSELEERTRSLGLNGVVRFAGYQTNVRDWIALSEFTILPSYYEGLPLTAIESLAAGRTVVATAVDGTTEVVIDRKTGLTVPPGNVEVLSQAIKELLGDPELRRTLSTSGRRWVEDGFSQERQVRQTENVYIRALRQKAPLNQGHAKTPWNQTVRGEHNSRHQT